MMETGRVKAMSKGDELWRRRRELLVYLYHEGPIAPDAGVGQEPMQKATGLGAAEFRAVVWSLRNEKKVGEQGMTTHLTAAGFKEAAEIVAQDRSPLVH
jgi:hypothetical protein